MRVVQSRSITRQHRPWRSGRGKQVGMRAGLIATAESQLESGGKQPAWLVRRDCLANALTYDARVCSAALYRPCAEKLRAEIVEVAAAVAGNVLSEQHVQRLLLRREEGGMDVHDLLRQACVQGQPQ